MFRKLARNRAIKQYLNKLPTAMRARYGASRSYSPGQVRATVGHLGLSQRHIEFAYLLFCSQELLKLQGMQPEQMDQFSAYMGEQKLLEGGVWDGALGGALLGAAFTDGGSAGDGLSGGSDGGF